MGFADGAGKVLACRLADVVILNGICSCTGEAFWWKFGFFNFIHTLNIPTQCLETVLDPSMRLEGWK